jgi:hypothetical protein
MSLNEKQHNQIFYLTAFIQVVLFLSFFFFFTKPVFHGTLAGVVLVVRVPQFDIPDLGNILCHYYCQIKWLLFHSFVSLCHEVHKINTK